MFAFFLLSVVTALLLTKLGTALSLRKGILDLPSPRGSHSGPMPRIGGIGIVAGFYLSMGTLWLTNSWVLQRPMIYTRDLWVMLGSAAGLAATGLYDDLYRLSPRGKFLIQLLFAVLVAGFGIRLESLSIPALGSMALGVLAIPITVLWLTGFANVYNFMDGIDGLAAGTGAVYSGFLMFFAWWMGSRELASVAALLGGSCLGFFLYNVPRVRTFMGDTGSLFLGMLFALLVVQLAKRTSGAASFPALLLGCSVFLYDSLFAILRRFRRGENIFHAHRSHLYQRLVQAGLTHRKVTAWYLLLHGVVGSLALT